MFFSKHGGHKSRHSSNPAATAVRLFLSLVIMAVLGIGLLMAYRSFSGYDPLKMSPKATLKSLLTSQGAYEFVTSLLAFNPKESVQKATEVVLQQPATDTQNTTSDSQSNASVEFSFAVIADSHRDITNLKKALALAKNHGVKFVIGIGDLSDVGTLDELRNTKLEFDTLGIPFYVIPGDHDLWDSRDKKNSPDKNFSEVFGKTYSAFSYQSTRFLLLYDSDNYLGLDDVQLKFIDDEIANYQQNPSKLFFAFAATPFYHPSSDHVMGKVTPKLKSQAEHLVDVLQKGGVNEVFFADTHFFSEYKEPTHDLEMTTVGAVTADRNPQSPRFAIVEILTDGSYNVKEVEVK